MLSHGKDVRGPYNVKKYVKSTFCCNGIAATVPTRLVISQLKVWTFIVLYARVPVSAEFLYDWRGMDMHRRGVIRRLNMPMYLMDPVRGNNTEYGFSLPWRKIRIILFKMIPIINVRLDLQKLYGMHLGQDSLALIYQSTSQNP